MPSNLLVCDKSVTVKALDHLVDCLSVPLGSTGAGTIFDVMGDATRGDKVSVESSSSSAIRRRDEHKLVKVLRPTRA